MKNPTFKDSRLYLFPKARKNDPLWGYYLEDLEDGTLRLRCGQGGTLALYNEKKKLLRIINKYWLDSPEALEVLYKMIKVLDLRLSQLRLR